MASYEISWYFKIRIQYVNVHIIRRLIPGQRVQVYVCCFVEPSRPPEPVHARIAFYYAQFCPVKFIVHKLPDKII